MGRKRSGIAKLMGFLLCSSSSSYLSTPPCFFCMKSSMDASHHRDDDDDGGGEEEVEAMSLMVKNEGGRAMRLKDALLSGHDDEEDRCQTLAFQLKPKTVTLRVSMHCYGCARQIEKRISKLDGVASYKVDLESKMVVVIGDIFPYEVLQSISRVKTAELWTNDSPETTPHVGAGPPSRDQSKDTLKGKDHKEPIQSECLVQL